MQGASDLKLKRVSQIMASNLGLKFKRLKKVDVRANCNQALIQRQQFAMTLIGLLLEGKRVINVDESAIGQGVYYRSGWSLAGITASQNVKPFGQRLSLLAAVQHDDSVGAPVGILAVEAACEPGEERTKDPRVSVGLGEREV